MDIPNLQTPVRDLVVKDASLAVIFDKYDIDYYCGGHLSLKDACEKKGLNAEKIMDELLDATSVQAGQHTENWAKRAPSKLIEHIVAVHHHYLREELPQLLQKLQKVTNKHGAELPILNELLEVFQAFESCITAHMDKEEDLLFPMIIQQGLDSKALQAGLLGLENTVASLQAEHQECCQMVETMQQLTANFTPPEGACNGIKSLFERLARLNADLHQHIHKENNILFPKALRTADSLGKGNGET